MSLKKKALKAGISVLIGVVIANIFKLKYPFFVILPIIMPISFSIQETFKAGINRIIGTFIGAAAGILLVMISPSNPLLSAAGVIIIIYFSDFIKWGNSASIAGLVFISILLGLKEENPWIYGFDRILSTLLGILITIGVNKLFFNVDLVNEIERSYMKIDKLIQSSLKEKILNGSDIDIDKINAEIEKSKKYLEICLEEIYIQSSRKMKIKYLKTILNKYYNLLTHLKIINDIKTTHVLDSNNSEIFREIFNIDYEDIDYKTHEDDIVFNFHIGIVFNVLLRQSEL